MVEISRPRILGIENFVFFLAFRQHRIVTMKEFCVAMGLYQDIYVDTQEFRLLSHDWLSRVLAHYFWGDIRHNECNASTCKGSQLKKPVYRVLLYILMRSTNGRIDFESVINASDMLQMYSMTMGYPKNVGVLMDHCVKHQ